MEDGTTATISPGAHGAGAHAAAVERARERFGAVRVDALVALVAMGDPLADAAIAEVDALGGAARRGLQRAIVGGLAAVESAPPAVRAFMAAVEQTPPWVDPARLARGSDAYLAIGQLWIMLSLGPGSLVHTYSSASIARVLVRTGNLAHMAERRLIETGTWNIMSVLPGHLERGAAGYVQNLQVRLLHARVRSTLERRGVRGALDGPPINQLELARTWLDFTFVPFSALGQFGITFTAAEIADLYHYWQRVAGLMGVDERIYRPVVDQRSGEELLAMIDSLLEGASADSRVLTEAMLTTLAGFIQPMLHCSPGFAFDFASAITRRLHGDELSDLLGVKRTWVSRLLPLFALLNRVQRAGQRLSPRLRRRAIARTTAFYRGQLALGGETTYQRELEQGQPDRLPQTVELSGQ